jgi:hypothetical protein
MQIEIQYIINVAFGIVSGIAIYLFNQSNQHEKRIQKIEDVQSIKIEDLKKDFEAMEKKIDALTKAVNELSLALKVNTIAYEKP